jgi:hypothetical protein
MVMQQPPGYRLGSGEDEGDQPQPQADDLLVAVTDGGPLWWTVSRTKPDVLQKVAPAQRPRVRVRRASIVVHEA